METTKIPLIQFNNADRASIILEAFSEFIEQVDGMTAKGRHRFHFDKVGQFTAISKKKLETDLRMVLAAMTDIMNSMDIVGHGSVKRAQGFRVEELVQEVVNNNREVADLIEADPRYAQHRERFREIGINLSGFKDQPMTSISRTEIQSRQSIFRSHVFIKYEDGNEVGMNITDYSFHLYLANHHGKKIDGRWKHTTHTAWNDAYRDEVTNRYQLVKGFLARKVLDRIELLQAENKLARDIEPPGLNKLVNDAQDVTILAKKWLSETESRVAKWANVAPRAALHKAELDEFLTHSRNAMNSRGTILPRIVKDVMEDTQAFIADVRAANDGSITHERDSIILRLRQEDFMNECAKRAVTPNELRSHAAGLVIQDYLEYTIGRMYGLAVGVSSNLAASRATQYVDPFTLLHGSKRGNTIRRVQTAFGDCLSALAMSKRYQNVVLDLLEAARDEGHPITFSKNDRTVVDGVEIGSWIADQFARIVAASEAPNMQALTSWQGKIGMDDGFKYVALHSSDIDIENYWHVEACEHRALSDHEIRKHFGKSITASEFDAFLESEQPNIFYP